MAEKTFDYEVRMMNEDSEVFENVNSVTVDDEAGLLKFYDKDEYLIGIVPINHLATVGRVSK